MRLLTSTTVVLAALASLFTPASPVGMPAGDMGVAPRFSGLESAGGGPVLEVLEEGGAWWRGPFAPEPEAPTTADCTVTIRWQTSAAYLDVERSKVRVRGLPWVELGERWGIRAMGRNTITPGEIYAYSDDPGNTLFFLTAPLNQDCDKRRRYRFRLMGRQAANGNERFIGIERDFYFPSSDSWTTDTNLDLGYLDLCLSDGHQCDGPYYPGGNPTPFPGPDLVGWDDAQRSRSYGLEADQTADPDPPSGIVDQGQDLTGDWVRTESNNNPNNGMRITFADDGATLTVVPSTASSSWRVGQVLWRNVRSDGTMEVRGSDGDYYPTDFAFQGSDRIDLDIHYNGRGNDQTWMRAGPSIEGEWVRVAAPGGENDGLKIRVERDAARIRYLPAGATRGLRTGGRIWRDITPSGALQVLGRDGEYHPASATLVGADRLEIRSDLPGIDGGIWARPGAVDEARKELAGPVEDPSTPGAGLTPLGDLPSIDSPPATPPPDAIRGACLATPLPADQVGVQWGWGLSSPTNDDPKEESLGIRELMMADFEGRRANTNMITDLERVRIPGMEDGFAFLWQPTGSRRFQWEEHRDLTSSELRARSQDVKDSGLRPSDVEAYETDQGTRYAGVWVENSEGIGWWADHDMTSEEYGQAFENLRASGYRLVDMEAYSTSAGLRFAAIWYQSCDNDNWRQLRNMDREDYQMEVDSRAELGFRVVDFESYETGAGQRYAAIWQKIAPGRAWAVRTDRTLNGFLNYHHQYVDEGLRLIDFESYDTPNGVRYAGVWAQNEARYDYPFRMAVDTVIQNYRTTHGLPGISVVVMQGDSLLYQRGFGWADSAKAKRAYSGTVYLTASVAKVIGATIAARLEERGEIDLSNPTSDYIPGLPAQHTHTVEQLLAKTGCVPHYAEATPTQPDTTRVYAYQMDALKAPTVVGNNQNPVQMWADTLLGNCTPGQHYRYSTHGYTYVGAALEEVTGKPIADIIANELTEPFGLTSMRTVTSEKWGGYGGLGVPPFDLAQGYVWNGTASVTRDYENTTWKVLGGGLQTNALDLARFGMLTLHGAIVSDTTRLWTDLTVGASSWNRSVSRLRPTGLGWAVSPLTPAMLVSGTRQNRAGAEHGGDGRGAGTLIRLYRDGDLVIAILTNQQRSSTLVNAAGNPTGHPIESLATAIATRIFSP